jgi:hypothetical protein
LFIYGLTILFTVTRGLGKNITTSLRQFNDDT